MSQSLMRRAERYRTIRDELRSLRLPADVSSENYDRVWDRRVELHREIAQEMADYRAERNDTEDADELGGRTAATVITRR